MENWKCYNLGKSFKLLLFRKHKRVKAIEEDVPICESNEPNTLPPIRFEAPTTSNVQQQPQQPAEVPTEELENICEDYKDKTRDEILKLARSELSQCCWYWKNLSRTEAQKKLNGKPNGSFLVRDSQTDKTFTLSFRSAGVTLHCRISLDENRQWSYIENVKSHSIMKLIEETMRRSEKSVFGFVKQNSKLQVLQVPFPVRLTHPIDRFHEVPSLQHLAKIVIREKFENLDKLPLPPAIIEYLNDSTASNLDL